MSLADYAASFAQYHVYPSSGNTVVNTPAQGSLEGQTQVDPSYYVLDNPSKFIYLTPEEDKVNSPKHYARGKFQVWDIIEHFRLNYNIGNVCKYILRGGVKTDCPIEDYKKAIAYLQREVDILEGRLDVRPK